MSKDIFLCSYPRSGNTWLRLLLCDIFMQKNGIATNSNNVLELSDNIIPDMHQGGIDDLSPDVILPFRILKTHNNYKPEYQNSILLFRNPADALCSYFHFQFGTDQLTTDISIDEFTTKEATNWSSHANSFLSKLNELNSLIITYEQLYKEPILTLRRILFFLDYKTDIGIIVKAIQNHTFDKHKGKWQLKEENGKSGAFFRRGKIDSAIDELKHESLEVIEYYCAKTYNIVKQLETNQIKDFNANY